MERAPQYVCVFASQVAMCIGVHRHKKVSDAVTLMWQRVAPASYREALRRNGLRSEEEVLGELVRAHGNVRALVERSMEAAHTSTEVAASYSGAHEELDRSTLDAEEKQVVDAAIRKNLYTGYGTRAEDEMLRHIREVLRIPCHADDATYKARGGEADGVPWYVCGRVDAVSDDGQLVLEVKNRVNRLFWRAPAYEAVQVQAYLELLGKDQGALVECFKPAGGEVQTNVIPIARDRAFWSDEVVPKLQRFVTFFVRLLRSDALQDAFLTSKRPSAMVAQCAG